MLSITQALESINNSGWNSQRVRLSGQTFTDDDVNQLYNILKKHSSIKSLEICICRINQAQILRLLRGLISFGLISLALKHVHITSELAPDIAACLQESPLKRLEVPYNSLADKGISWIAQALKQSSLELLQVRQNEIGPSGAQDLASAIGSGLTNLKVLDISKNAIQNAGAIAIAKVIESSKLENLHMEDCRISEEGIIEVCNAVARSSLMTELSIASNTVKSHACLEAINNMLANSSLEVLVMERCDLDGQDLIMLAKGVAASKTLQKLKLKENYRIDNTSMLKFMDIIGPHLTLAAVELEESGVTRSCQDTVAKKLDVLHGERAKAMTTMLSAIIVPRVGSKSSLKLPRDLIRLVGAMLPPFPAPQKFVIPRAVLHQTDAQNQQGVAAAPAVGAAAGAPAVGAAADAPAVGAAADAPAVGALPPQVRATQQTPQHHQPQQAQQPHQAVHHQQHHHHQPQLFPMSLEPPPVSPQAAF